MHNVALKRYTRSNGLETHKNTQEREMKKYTLQELALLKRQALNGTISRSDLENLGLEGLYSEINLRSYYDPQGNELHQEIGMCQHALPSEHRFGMRGIVLEAIRDLENEVSQSERIKNRDTREIDHSFFINRTFKKAGE